MKYILFSFFVFFGFSLVAQEAKPIAKKIEHYHQERVKFEPYRVFSRNTSPEKVDLYNEMAKDAVVLNLNSDELERLQSERPEVIEISFPYQDHEITVELFRKNILTDGFYATDERNERLDYEPGLYYRGIVQNDPTSIVAFSFFKKGAMGVASALGTGNVVVGKTKTSPDYLSYTDHTLTSPNPFRCGVEESVTKQLEKSVQDDVASQQTTTLTTNCVRIYYEIAYQPYLDNNSDNTATLNWITGVHNNIATLYANDDIQIALSDVLVWTNQDPYINDYETNLSDFRNNRLAFDGDLAHLVNSPSTTSVAFLNSLCEGSRYAYSGVSQFYNLIPTYSWTIQAMTHEMGHALGSPHTHACAWNGNNTAIDGCGPAAGFDENCDAALPASGTIMSYCHLVPSVGINLANGFGTQPATLIQNTIDSKNCLGTDCTTSCIFTISSLALNINSNSATVNIIDGLSTSWDYRIFPYGGNPWNWSWTNTTSHPFQVTGLQANTYYEFQIKNNCDVGYTDANIRRLFLTDGDYCNGTVFTDTGGANGDYGDRQTFVKTFYPDSNTSLTLTFTSFDLEEDYDFMTVYDGENTAAPIFLNGENLTGSTVPGLFTSTNAAGAITVKFTSDQAVNEGGWEANFTCIPLGVNEFTSSSEIMVYPNPSTSLVNIESKSPMNSIDVYDLLGRLVKGKNNLHSNKAQLSLDGLQKGVYFIQVLSGNRMQTIKLIKE